ncbi:MAG TPA: glycosyltransferase [Anaerolineaceae bacterium]|nr:glycosyltransferase [Anaerolineaceae bacterium]
MKIACISSSQVPATTANSIQVMKVCQALAQSGHSVELWVPGKQAVDLDWYRLAGLYGLSEPFPVHWTPIRQGRRRYDLAWSAMQAANRWGADLIYTWMPQAALAGLLDGNPVILEVHDRIMGRLGPLVFHTFLRFPGKKRVLVITGALRRVLEASFHYHFPQKEIVIAPNGVDLDRYRNLPEPAAARRQLGLAECLTACYTGHFYAGRGMEVLVSLARCYPQVQFLWVGGKPEAVREWQARLDADGLGNVRLTGFIDNRILPVYQAAGEILLMPYERSIAGSGGGNSVDICSPMKMFEYMAAGRAILTSDLAVLHEVLNGANARFVPPEDEQAWQAGLKQLLDDADLRWRLGEQARRDIQQYTWLARAQRSLQSFTG